LELRLEVAQLQSLDLIRSARVVIRLASPTPRRIGRGVRVAQDRGPDRPAAAVARRLANSVQRRGMRGSSQGGAGAPVGLRQARGYSPPSGTRDLISSKTRLRTAASVMR
jgi:hypothetical protein